MFVVVAQLLQVQRRLEYWSPQLASARLLERVNKRNPRANSNKLFFIEPPSGLAGDYPPPRHAGRQDVP
jgi:hypothetical protein